MGAFNTKRILNGNPSLITAIADRICETFASEGYEIKRDSLLSGGIDISLTKGGLFKAIIGMKTALKVSLIPQGDSITFDAGVGIFGQQALPTVISLLFYWPVLLTQIWGLVKQANLDDKAVTIAEAVINESGGKQYMGNMLRPSVEGQARFCTNCGTRLSENAHFCSNCGTHIN